MNCQFLLCCMIAVKLVYANEESSKDWIEDKIVGKDKGWLSLFIHEFPKAQYEIIDTHLGLFWTNDSRFLINCNAKENENKEFILKHVKEGSNVIDIGASNGIHSITMSKTTGENGQVFCFEYQPKNFRELVHNVFINKCKNIQCCFFAVGNNNESSAEISIPLQRHEDALEVTKEIDFSVPYKSIDSLNLENVSLIKINIDNNEKLAIEGAYQTITRCKPAILVKTVKSNKSNIDNEHIKNQNQIIQKILNLGYKVSQSKESSDDFYCLPKQEPSKIVEIVTGFNIEDMSISREIMQKYNIDLLVKDSIPSVRKVFFEPSISDKIVVFNFTLDPEVLSIIPKEKLIHFLWEPWHIDSAQYELYGKVYTWNDDLVDNVKFHKIYYPSLMPMISNITPFNRKKLCVMVSGCDHDRKINENDLYCERMRMVEFFETKPKGEFEIYGKDWQRRVYRDYIGPIPGFHSGPEKTSILSGYRFSICFENTKELNGYITEKIFCCFAAGCVPIYWGAKNIESYIPKGCFIDYRDFKNKEEMYDFIKNMSEKEYKKYITNIQLFLKSEKAKVFTPEYFQKTFYEAITKPI